MLDAFCTATGSHCKAAVRLLTAQGRRGRPPRYELAMRTALERTWAAAGHSCDKRLAPFLATFVPALERHVELPLTPEVCTKLLALSAATIDRLLAPSRQRLPRRPFTQQSASPAPRAQIPVRTFGEWTDVVPGAFQADLVPTS